MTYLKFINEDLKLTNKLKALEKRVFVASDLIYETLKKIVKYLFVAMVVQQLMQNIYQQNF